MPPTISFTVGSLVLFAALDGLPDAVLEVLEPPQPATPAASAATAMMPTVMCALLDMMLCLSLEGWI